MRARIKRDKESNGLPPIIGKIKIGEMAESKRGKSYPKALDYFKATGKFSAAFEREAGEKPDSLTVCFLTDDQAFSCDERWEMRDGSGRLLGYGDGETFYGWSKAKEEYIQSPPEETEKVRKVFEKKGYVVLTLRFVCLNVRSVWGVWEFKTKASKSSIDQIRDSFDYMLDKRGSVQGIAFDLSVKMHKSNKPGSTSRYPVVSLVATSNDVLKLGSAETYLITEESE